MCSSDLKIKIFLASPLDTRTHTHSENHTHKNTDNPTSIHTHTHVPPLQVVLDFLDVLVLQNRGGRHCSWWSDTHRGEKKVNVCVCACSECQCNDVCRLCYRSLDGLLTLQSLETLSTERT